MGTIPRNPAVLARTPVRREQDVENTLVYGNLPTAGSSTVGASPPSSARNGDTESAWSSPFSTIWRGGVDESGIPFFTSPRPDPEAGSPSQGPRGEATLWEQLVPTAQLMQPLHWPTPEREKAQASLPVDGGGGTPGRAARSAYVVPSTQTAASGSAQSVNLSATQANDTAPAPVVGWGGVGKPIAARFASSKEDRTDDAPDAHVTIPAVPAPTRFTQAKALVERGPDVRRDHVAPPPLSEGTRQSFVSRMEDSTDVQPCVMQGFRADAIQPRLRYGDAIYLLPEGTNGIVAYAGGDDARPWVEFLKREVGVPPNLRDCQWRVQPPRQYVEARKLQKLLKHSTWDDGRKLPLPPPPPPGQSLDALASEIVSKHKLSDTNVEAVRDVLIALRMLKEEQDGNLVEQERQRGSEIRFGYTCILIHESTGNILTVTKQRALEATAKKVGIIPDGNGSSILVVKPAFKTYAEGTSIASGDIVTFQSQKTIAGSHYQLHMSNLPDLNCDATRVQRALKVEHSYIPGGQEINCTAGEQRPTLFRVMLFSPLESANAEAANTLKCEDVVSFYHKHFAAYLSYDPSVQATPMYYASERINVKSRKKCSWMWKIEKTNLLIPGSDVVASDSAHFRIKHLITNTYLMQQGSGLAVTKDYNRKETCFSFKHFAKQAGAEHISTSDMIYIKGNQGEWLTLADDDDDDDRTTMPIQFKKMDLVPDSDALLILPIRASALRAVVQVRRLVLVISDYFSQLKMLPDPMEAAAGSAATEVLTLVSQSYTQVYEALHTLVVNCSFGENPDPMSRDGIPNRYLQKLLRELGVVNLVVEGLQLPFKKGIPLDELTGENSDQYAKCVRLLNMQYRLLKQMCKADLVNSRALYAHLRVLRSHLGKGILCTPTIKEIFAGKRELLNHIDEEFIDHFVKLLQKDKAPQYIDFLMSLCIDKSGPLPKIQGMIADRLLIHHSELLPQVLLETKQGTTMHLTISGIKDPSTGKDIWLDLAQFKKTKEVRGREQDYVGWIMNATLSELTPAEKAVRYFVRCSNLYGKLATGRNQGSLKALISNRTLALSYAQILAVISEPRLPYLIRARYVTLMSKLYVDRDPQTSTPQVSFTRVWSKVSPEESDLDMTSVAQAASIPVCTTGFKDLEGFVLRELPKLADCTDATGKPSLNGKPRIGQLELIASIIAITDELVGFGFFIPEHDARQEPDFSRIRIIYQAVFALLDSREGTHDQAARAADMSDEACFKCELRSDALKLLLRFFNMRLNSRLSSVIYAWEDIFEQIVAGRGLQAFKLPSAPVSLMSSPASMVADDESQEQIKRLSAMFSAFDPAFEKLDGAAFGGNIVSTPDIGTDIYRSFNHKDTTIAVMLDLCTFKNAGMTQACLSLLIRNMSQRVTLMTALKDVQILVFPAAVKVYQESKFIIKKLGSLHKHLNADKPDAYHEATSLLARITDYLTESPTNKREIVQKNQTIMLNLDLDKPVRNLLGLPLQRDTSRRDRGELEADIPTNMPRKDLFQACYTFLKALATRNHKAQTRLFQHINMFADHMGIEKLNVADTISEIVRDNSALCAKVSENFFRLFVSAIRTWGRRARWLRFFLAFILVKGKPIKRNQDLVLRLLMEDAEAVLDLTCDYSRADCRLSKADDRYGQTRLMLMVQADHKRSPFSLLDYHRATLSVLAMLAAGKNAENQGKIGTLLPLSTIISNILYADVSAEGLPDPRLRSDALRFVQAPWVKLMTEIYFLNNDSLAIGQVHASDAIFKNDRATGKSTQADKRSKRYLIEIFVSSVEALASRLQNLDASQYENEPELLNGVSDAEDADLGIHFQLVVEVVAASNALFSRFDTFFLAEHAESVKRQSQSLRNGAVILYGVLSRLRYEKISHSIVELITCMTALGIEGPQLVVVPDAEAPHEAGPGREECFKAGWTSFCSYFAHRQGIDLKQGAAMNESIKDMALLFGSSKTYHNETFQSLKELMKMLCNPECEESIKLTGLKVIRGIIYMNPDEESSSEECNNEYERMLQNLPPSALGSGDGHLMRIQALIAKLGCVEIVTKCIESDNPEIIMATLKLCVALLDGGNRKVQEMFADSLRHSSSQPFFFRLMSLFQQSVNAIRDMKRKVKQAAAEKAALLKAGISKKTEEAGVSLASSQVHMVEVMKTMRRMCMGQFKPLQDILRVQRLNHSSFDLLNEAVQYIKNLETELKDAILNGEFELVDGAIRGFLMLADACRGPNLDNQKGISDTGIYDLCDRIFARIRFEHIDKSTADKELATKRNVYRSSLKSAAMEALSALVEGVQDEVITDQMLALLQWHGLVDQIKHCYQSYDRGTDLPPDVVLSEGISYFFLLKHLKNYDRRNEFIAPALAHAPQKILDFFEMRTGYVEILRDERLERVYYQLPEDCVRGTAFDAKPFDEMYAAEREDVEKKSRDFVQNMVHIVDKIQFHDQIRKSKLAWTVKKWDLIRQVNFIWTFALHGLLICGGYMPYYSKRDYADLLLKRAEEEAGGGDRRKAAAGVNTGDSSDSSDFELTNSDVYFFEEVLPKVEWIARVMSWINLITCGLRFFAFMHSEMPIIVRRAMEEAEAEVEDDEAVEEEEGEEEEEEENLDIVFVENHSQTAGYKAVAQNDAAEGTTEDKSAENSTWWQALVIGVTSPAVQYECAFSLFPVLAVVTDEPLFSIYALFEICSWKGSKTVIDAVVTNFPKMGQALLLGLLFMYTWMVLGMVTLRIQHDDDLCSNMFQCFSTYLFKTIRDNGVREVLTEPGDDFKFPHNLYDAFVGEDLFIWRLVWDVLFQIIFIYILLAIITGIVIDGFGALKEEKEADEEDLKSVCFVCNVDRFTADQSGIGFDKHVKVEHRPKWYLFFLLYLQRKSLTSMTGQERYVFERVWPGSGACDFRWLPREQTFTIHKGEEADETLTEVQGLRSDLLKLSARVDANHASLAEAMARIETALSQVQSPLQQPAPR